MARIRTLKPEIASDAKLSKVSIEAAYTFVLMITQADDAGLLPGAHRQILGILYPLRETVTVPVLLGWIEELVSIGLVRWRVTRDGVPVVQLVNWSKHQRIDNAGRSQLAGLLADDDGEPSESRGDSPRTAANGGESPLGIVPTTKDHGPKDQDVGTAARLLTSAANKGLAEHPDCPQPIPRILASSGRTVTAAEKLLGAGVPLAFAESAVYALAKSHNAEGEVRSLTYFTDAVIRRWQEHQEAANASASRPSRPPPGERASRAGPRPVPQSFDYSNASSNDQEPQWQD